MGFPLIKVPGISLEELGDGTEMLLVHQSLFKNNGGSISFDHSAHDPFGASLLLQLEI